MQATCPKCDGSGKVAGKRTCRVCKGDGIVEVRTCPVCRGSGEVTGVVKCDECNGTGKIIV